MKLTSTCLQQHRRGFSALVIGLLFLFTPTAQGVVVIDFDTLSTGIQGPTIVYPEATFSSTGGRLFVEAVYVESLPNSMCPLHSVDFSCEADLTVDFATPVNDLSFYIMGEEITNVGTVDVYTDGVFNATVTMIGDGAPDTPNFVDLTSFVNVTKLFMPVPADPAGILYDTFQFNAVPEPASALLLLCGLAALMARDHKSRA